MYITSKMNKNLDNQGKLRKGLLSRQRAIHYAPLCLCLLIGASVRLFLILHGDPSIAGDEAMTGIQAENILRGLHPIYYYNQPYMGSLEAYILALFFAIAGPSVFVLRIATGCVSLILVILTWLLSSALATQARLKKRTKYLFVFLATLISALPPLYGTILEMRSLGGYAEAMVIMLWILLAALRLTQRWQAQASNTELLVRWSGFGFLAGLGLWVNPLTVYALVTAFLWIGGNIIIDFWKSRSPQYKLSSVYLRQLFLASGVLPGIIVGFMPGIIYGFRHNWANILYMLKNGSGQQSTITTKLQLLSVYAHCTAPRAIGGSLPTEPYVQLGHPSTFTPALAISFICIVLACAAILLSYIWRRPALIHLRQLTLIPITFMTVTTAIFCSSSIVAQETPIAGCSQIDLTGRYAGPLVLAIPFVLSAVIAIGWQAFTTRKKTPTTTTVEIQTTPKSRQNIAAIVNRAIMLLVIAIYFLSQSYYYIASDPHTVFKNPNCIKMAENNAPIDQYMQQNNIRYAFATGWIADPITFTTNSSVLVTEPPSKARIPADALKVLNADHYAYLFFVKSSDKKAAFQQILDQRHYQYTAKRFASQPGWDIIVINPTKKIPLTDPAASSFLHSTIYDEC